MNRNQPISTPGSSKYGNKGKYMDQVFKGLNISEKAKAALSEAGDYSLAKSTWGTYNTAARMLAECARQTQRSMSLPLSQEDTLEFIGWLLSERKVKSGTINSYLAGIRQLHIMRGMEPPHLKSTLVKFILRGGINRDNIERRREVKRLPITINMMKILKGAVKSWTGTTEDKLLMWTICTTAFHGGFRIHEILCKSEKEFDPDFTLMTEDVKLIGKSMDDFQGQALQIKLKCPKENKTGQATIVELYETQGNLCPVKAFRKWTRIAKTIEGQPLFRKEDGTPVTGARLNKWLKERLGRMTSNGNGKFTSHSFRIGLASSMAAGGVGDKEIKEAGRWSSNAYELYMRLPQVRRAKAAKAITKLE